MKLSTQRDELWLLQTSSREYELNSMGLAQHNEHDYDYILEFEDCLLEIQVNAPINVIALDIRCLYFS